MKLKESFPEVEDVLLFGSLVRDDYGADSDADVLIILKGSRFSRFFDRIPDFVPFFSSVSVSVDLFPYTREETERMIGNGNRFIARAAREGRSLISAR